MHSKFQKMQNNISTSPVKLVYFLCMTWYIYTISPHIKRRTIKYVFVWQKAKLHSVKNTRDHLSRDTFQMRIIWDGWWMCHYVPWILVTWWCHQMEIFSTSPALCAGNSPVTGEFPSQRPVTRSFDAFLHLRLKNRLSKPWRRRWFETPLRSLWRHCNGM